MHTVARLTDQGQCHARASRAPGDVEDFEDLLDLLEKQTEKTTGAVQALSRLLAETHEDLTELREGIEALTQKADRLVVMMQGRTREAGE